jgi:hypothetical protein
MLHIVSRNLTFLPSCIFRTKAPYCPGRLSEENAPPLTRGLLCRECGVLVKVDRTEEGGGGAELGVFTGQVPVPMEWPSRELAADGRQPWFSRG